MQDGESELDPDRPADVDVVDGVAVLVDDAHGAQPYEVVTWRLVR